MGDFGLEHLERCFTVQLVAQGTGENGLFEPSKDVERADSVGFVALGGEHAKGEIIRIEPVAVAVLA